MITLKKIIFQFLILIHRTLQRWLGASTAGVRILLFNQKREVMLVKHTYVDGWHFPGGGVNHCEPLHVGATRELEEETGIIALEKPRLFNIYVHEIYGVTDYPTLFIIDMFKENPQAKLSPEILEAKWFSLDDLPKDITPSTKRCLDEFFDHAPIRDKW